MRKKHNAQAVEQLNLFVPPPQRPTWGQLARPIKPRLVELVAELLRGQRRRKASPENVKEAGDE